MIKHYSNLEISPLGIKQTEEMRECRIRHGGLWFSFQHSGDLGQKDSNFKACLNNIQGLMEKQQISPGNVGVEVGTVNFEGQDKTWP